VADCVCRIKLWSGDRKQKELSSEEIKELEKYFPKGWKEALSGGLS